MANGLMATTISQFGLEYQSPVMGRHQGSMLFTQILLHTKQSNFWKKLFGREKKLKDLAQIAPTARRRPAQQMGITYVPLHKIVGSEGRVQDFDRHFNPLNERTRERWVGIIMARSQGVTLPPVELIQAGEEYYVRDGHHRISVAHALGQVDIEAQIVSAIAY